MNNNIWVVTSTLEVQSNENKNWSSEDDMNLMNAILASEKEWGANSYTSKWLKSIKDRVQPHPKQEWSEVDEKNFQMLQKIICNSDATANLANKLSNWLKSIKEKM